MFKEKTNDLKAEYLTNNLNKNKIQLIIILYNGVIIKNNK